MPRFDWYQCTTDLEADEVIGALVRELDLASVRPCRAINNYHHGVELYRQADERLCAIFWGGNPGTHVLVSGGQCDEVVPALRYAVPVHRVTRVDVAEDFEAAGLFDAVTAELLQFALRAGLTLDYKGDWERGRARSLYLGSVQSATRLVVYEKGYEQGLGLSRPNWVRVEARIRPQTAEARYLVSGLPPEACLGASWLPRALDAISWLAVDPVTITKPWRSRSDQRARAALVVQYGATLEKWAAEVGGWEQLGAILRDEVSARAA